MARFLLIVLGILVLHGLIIIYLGRQDPAPSTGDADLSPASAVPAVPVMPGDSPLPGRIDQYMPPILTPEMEELYRNIENNRFDDAEKSARAILEGDPDNSRAMVALGEIQERRGNLRESLKTYTTAHGIRPDDPWPLERMARNWMLLDRPDEALKCIATIEETGRLDPFGQGLKADAYLLQGAGRKQKGDPRWQEDARMAGEIIIPLVRDNPQWEFQVLAGNLHLLTDQKKQAVKAYENAISSGNIFPSTRIDVLMALTSLYHELGDNEKSQQYLNQLVAFLDNWKPREYSRSLYLREYALVFQEVMLGSEVPPGRMFTHRRYYRDLYRDRLQLPQVEVDQTLYILSEMVDMEWDEGIEVCIEEVNEYMSLAHGPDYPECFFNKMVNRPMRYLTGYVRFGDVYRKFGQNDRAREYYEKALKISPGNRAVMKRIQLLTPVAQP